MGSVQATLTAGTPVLVPIPIATGRIVISQSGGVPAEVYVTSDGSYPSFPTTTPNNNDFHILAGVAGAQVVISPRLYGDHFAAVTLRFASQGTPTVQIEW